MPRSLILNKNLNLKNYYNKQISLTKGEVLYQSQDEPYYIPEIKYEGKKICELDSTFVAYKGQGPLYKIPKRSDDYRYNLEPNIAIEKKDNELLAYFADNQGRPINIQEQNINIDDIYNHNFNVHLRSVLLEHSNIREVLPELREALPEVNVDNSLYSDIRQLGCLVTKTSTIQQIANELATDSTKRSSISRAIISEEPFRHAVKSLLNRDAHFQGAVASNTDLQEGVAAKLRENPGRAQGPAGRDGYSPSANAVAAQLMNDQNRPALVTEVASNQDLQKAVADNGDLRTAVTNTLKSNKDFKGSVKGDPGKDGQSPDPASVAAQLLTGEKKDTLVTEVAGNQDLRNAVASNPGLRDAVTDTLKNEGNLGGGDISKIVDSLKPKFTLQEGKELSQNIYEAKVILDDKVIATLPKIGYYMLDDQLVMHNYATQEKVVIPEDFLCLKVVRLGSGFGNDDYKLTFCNIRGNEFFEYKKYDPEYSRVPDEYKFISLSHAKKEYNPNLSELISHRPLFLIAGELAKQGSDKYEAAVFELTRDGKGKKMATLINEFGYFHQNGKFIHCNYHKEPQCRSDTSAEIYEKYQVTDADSEFYLTKYNDIAIHTIPEL
ncbi:MAG: hypothetical protein LKM45_01155 [Wolbachia endosymbiont of Alcedoecus sp.]|nr:hypothetical protein [Wolbachia endosymbiont of Alcedoecus sp.]